MALTPVEIRHMTPSRGLFGYRTGPTDRLLTEIAASFEDVWRERADLADRVEQLEADLVRYRELESLLRTTLVSAERASAEMREQARKEAELILGEAHAEARAVQRRALDENERLLAESRRLRAQLTAALTVLEEPESAVPPQPGSRTQPVASPEPEAPPAPATAPAPPPLVEERPSPEQAWHDLAGLPLADADAA